MKRFVLLAAVVCASAGLSFAGDAPSPVTAPPVPGAEAFGALPVLRHPELSPDGTYFACIQAMKGRPVLTINKIGDTSGKWPVALPVPDMIIDDFRWAKNDKLILRLKWSHELNGRQESFYHFVAVSADGTNATPLAEDKAVAASVTTNLRHRADIVAITDIAYDDPTNIYAHMSDGGLARIDITTGTVRSNNEPNFDKDLRVVRKWITDGHGHPLARVDQTVDPLIDHLMIKEGETWTEIASGSANAEHGIYAAGLMEDGKALAVFNTDGPFDTVERIELAPGHARSLLFAAPKYDVDTLMVDERTRQVKGVTWWEDGAHTVYFDSELASIQRGLESQFPGKNIWIVSSDLARSKVFFGVSAANEAPVYLYLNRTTHVAKPIGRSYPALRDTDLGTFKLYPYKARDGLAIPTYLTLPPRKEAKALPLVVIVHSFDTARIVDNYNWLRSFFATRGYAVVEPNYRGSSGYGRDFAAAGKKQWGLKMQDDITDGVKKLIADGIADPKRICIIGEDFGGFTALAGAAFTPGLYACAVSVNGITDPAAFVQSISQDYSGYSKVFSGWKEWVGDPSTDSAQLRATSPAFNADKIGIPVLLIHSTGNTGVRIEQSETMERALKRAGKNVTFIRIDKDDGDLDTAEARIRVLAETEKFLKANIGN